MPKIKKKQIAILFLSVVFCTTLLSLSSAEDAYFPVWEIGNSWKVKVVYPSVFKSDGWSDPVFWTYEVSESSDCSDLGDDCFELTISGGSERDNMDTRVVILAESRHMVLVPIQIRQEKSVRGVKIEETTLLNPGGPFVVVTGEILIPYDIPVFPMVPDSRRTLYRKRAIGEKLRTKEQVTQKTELINFRDGHTFSNRGSLLKVTCSDDRGRILFTQLWDKEKPWPLYGENKKMRYWLVSSNE